MNFIATCGMIFYVGGLTMERVKDFLYDISDLFFSLLIIALIFFVVALKLNDTMGNTWFSNISSSDDAKSLDHIDVTTPDLNKPIVDLDPVTPVEPEEPIETEEPTEEVVELRDVNFEIAMGSPGYTIATKLKGEQLISDVDEFLQTLADMKLGNSLRAGTHKLNTGMSIEEIILKLSGQ